MSVLLDLFSRSEWQVNNLSGRLLGSGSSQNQVEIVDASADRNVLLMRKDNGRKRQSASLAPNSFGEEIRISREDDASETTCPVEKLGVEKTSGAVFLRRQDVMASPPQRSGDRRRDMDIHVDSEAHSDDDFNCRSRRCKGDSPSSAFQDFTSRSRRRISSSKSAA